MSELKRLKIKDIGQIDSGFAFSSSDFQELGLPVIRMSDLKKGYVQTKTAARVPSSKTIGLEKFQIKPGDLLLGMSGSLDAYGVASEGVELSFINQRVGRFSVFDEEKSCYAFFSKLLTSSEYLRYAFKEAVGVAQLNISPKQIEDFSFPQIPLEEQRYIAQILDTLDTAIHETEAIIAKLKAIKQGLLHDLLTRGIDANGELRPPQTEAPHLYKESPLGWIPREWEIESINRACSDVVDCPHSTPNYQDQGVLVARTMHIKDGAFLETQASRVSERQYQERVVRLEPRTGDVIFTREAPVGEAFVISLDMRICLGQRVMLLRPKNGRLVAEYLLAQIYSGAVKDRIATLTSGTTNPHLNVSEVKEFEIPLPLFVEQQEIAKRLNEHESRLQSEISKQKKLSLLKTGLMDDLLTGRVRVTPLLVEASQQ